MNWGKGILLSFVSFAIFVTILVVICFRQDISLVSIDYYQKELRFQEQIDQMNNASSLTTKPVFEIFNQILTVDFPESVDVDRGEIYFFRPSDGTLDRRFKINFSNDRHRLFSLAGMSSGMYKLRMSWWAGGKGYYIEKSVKL